MNEMTKVAAANVVNGINVDDVKGLIAAVQDDASAGMTSWKVASEWQGGTHNRSTVEGFGMGGDFVERRFTIDVDEPLQLGGTNRFANPQEYLLAGINSCMMVGYAALCALNGITIETLEIVTEGDIDLRGFLGLAPVNPGYDRLKSRVRLVCDGTREQVEEIHRMVQATSPNYANVTRPIVMDHQLVTD